MAAEDKRLFLESLVYTNLLRIGLKCKTILVFRLDFLELEVDR